MRVNRDIPEGAFNIYLSKQAALLQSKHMLHDIINLHVQEGTKLACDAIVNVSPFWVGKVQDFAICQ